MATVNCILLVIAIFCFIGGMYCSYVTWEFDRKTQEMIDSNESIKETMRAIKERWREHDS